MIIKSFLLFDILVYLRIEFWGKAEGGDQLEDLGVDRTIMFPVSEGNRMGGCGLDLSGTG